MESITSFTLEEVDKIELIQAEIRWRDFIQKLGNKETQYCELHNDGYMSWGYFADEDYVEVFRTEMIFIAKMGESENDEGIIVYEWDWGEDNRIPEHQELINSAKAKLNEEYGIKLNNFFTTSELLIRYIVASTSNIIGFDNITQEPGGGEYIYIIGHRIINGDKAIEVSD